MSRTEKTNSLVLTALMACLVLLTTYIIRIPSPFTQGYVHLGDSMIFLSALILGKKGGAAAGGLGSALSDLLGGYAAYAPWTFVIKGLMAFIMGAFIEAAAGRKKNRMKIGSVPIVEITGMALGGAEMVAGYILADGTLAGNIWAGLLGAPFNAGQFIIGMALAVILAAALYKTPAKKFFVYRFEDGK